MSKSPQDHNRDYQRRRRAALRNAKQHPDLAQEVAELKLELLQPDGRRGEDDERHASRWILTKTAELISQGVMAPEAEQKARELYLELSAGNGGHFEDF